uniref:Uncharacterized protein n=1 Tax=Ditylenchus dipsaci TaxID=166011 RepID=A0A915D622_9BILA
MLDTRSWQCTSMSDEQSAHYPMLAEVTNEIISVAMEREFLSIRVRSNPIGICCTLASLAEQRIKTFPNKAIKHVCKTLL